MPDPQIIPPPPTITQHAAAADDSPGLEQVQRAFDQVLPPVKPAQPQTPSPAPEPPQKEPAPPSEQPPPPQEPPPQEPATPPSPAPPKPPEEADAPSFLEQALRGEAPTPPSAPAPEEWPEELPEFKNKEESRARYKKWRQAYGDIKHELDTLRARPAQDEAARNRLEVLENQNKQYQDLFTRMGVEQSAEFQQNIMRPLYASWNDAARIVQESGGDPNELAKAMSLSGKSQFEALDELFGEMPESAKIEAHDALRTYRRYEEARRAAIANAPQALEGIRQREAQRQMHDLNAAREDMKGIFERTLKRLRDDVKLEVLLKSDLPEAQWWNQQGEKIVQQARDLYLENTDMHRVAAACLLAPAADVFRKLWINSQKKIGQLQKVINERAMNEPDLSESGGPGAPVPEQQLKEDLKRPFHEVFLREFHRAQGRNR